MPTRFEPVLDEADELLSLAARLARLTVSHRSPEKFFEDRSELVHAIRQIARRA